MSGKKVMMDHVKKTTVTPRSNESVTDGSTSEDKGRGAVQGTFAAPALMIVSDLSITTSTGKNIVQNLSFSVHPGDRLAIIGAEGSGKSSIVEYMAGMERDGFTYKGDISQLGFGGYLPQELPHEWLDTELGDFILKRRPDEELEPSVWERYNDLLCALRQVDLSREALSQKLSSMSGGERVRAQLAKLLFNEPSFLLLDEPTNNLDLATIRWLEKFICNAKVPVLFVSHDEALIRQAATGILYLANRVYDNKCFAYFSGEGYDDFLSRLHRSAEQAESDRVNLQREIKKLKKEHVERQNKVIGANSFSGAEDAATKGRMMRAAASNSRSTASFGKKIQQKEEELKDFEVPHIETSVKLEFPQDCIIPASKTVLSLMNEKLEVGSRVLVPSFNLEIIGPQKVGIIGDNGAGKTTLLRKIQSAEMRPGIRLGYMPQDFNEVLSNPNESGLSMLTKLGVAEHIVRAFMSRMGFSRGEMATPCEQLSGGQRGKLILMQTVLKGGNLLVLDEPTRNLSPITAPVLKEQLRDYPGAVVLVSHDRLFLKDVCSVVYHLSSSGLKRIDEETLL